MKKFIFLIAFVAFTFTSCATRVVTPAPTNTVIALKNVPRNHKVVVVNGKRYYSWNGKRYRKTNRGYILVKG